MIRQLASSCPLDVWVDCSSTEKTKTSTGQACCHQTWLHSTSWKRWLKTCVILRNDGNYKSAGNHLSRQIRKNFMRMPSDMLELFLLPSAKCQHRTSHLSKKRSATCYVLGCKKAIYMFACFFHHFVIKNYLRKHFSVFFKVWTASTVSKVSNVKGTDPRTMNNIKHYTLFFSTCHALCFSWCSDPLSFLFKLLEWMIKYIWKKNSNSNSNNTNENNKVEVWYRDSKGKSKTKNKNE